MGYIRDGESKSYASVVASRPHEDDVPIRKLECVGHVQKRMGSALRKLIATYSNRRLSDGKSIGSKGTILQMICINYIIFK